MKCAKVQWKKETTTKSGNTEKRKELLGFQHPFVNTEHHSAQQPRVWKKEENRKMFFDWLGTELGHKSMDEWYKVTVEDIYKYGGRGLLQNYYNGSPSRALATVYPEHSWIPWKFSVTQQGFWKKGENHKKFFDWLGTQLGHQNMDGWYNVTQEDIHKHGGTRLLIGYYNGSPSKALMAVYPEHNWILWKFSVTQQGFWKKEENHKKFFDWLGIQLGHQNMDEWYNVTVEDIQKHGGHGLLDGYYNNSPSKALMAVYHEHKWDLWKFSVTQHGFWKKEENHKMFFDWLGTQLGHKNMDEWYNVTQEDIHRYGGRGFLSAYHNDSPSKALMVVYPEHKWVLWKFSETPHGFWKKEENQKMFFDWLGIQLGYKNMDEWYNVTQEDIYKHGRQGLLHGYYNGSPSKALMAVYPEHNWMVWRFSYVPVGFWSKLSVEKKKEMFEWLEKKLWIRELDDWYRVSTTEVQKEVGNKELLADMLVEVYPEHNWDIERWKVPLQTAPRLSQRILIETLESLLLQQDVREEYLHADCKSYSSGIPMELDAYVPALNLAFEYQGEQHYMEVYKFGEQANQAARDDEKKELCIQEGITLIQVPYWWDKSKDSLATTISTIRPDIILHHSNEAKSVEETQEILLKDGPPIAHPFNWNGKDDLTRWFLSEKLDGIRAYWDGGKLMSRQTNEIKMIKEVMEILPSVPLDGELCMGRELFEHFNGLLQSEYDRQESKLSWSRVGFHIYDLPFSNASYGVRLLQLNRFGVPPWCHIVHNMRCNGAGHLLQLLDTVEKDGGEGLVARSPNSPYVPGRSNSMLKVKRFEDSEVLVLEVLPSGLHCQQHNGELVMVQCPLDVVMHPPSLGSVVTVKHHGFTSNETLKAPKFWRERRDLTWETPKQN